MRPSSELTIPTRRLLLIAATCVVAFFFRRRHDDGSCIKETKDVVGTSENGTEEKADGRKEKKKGGNQ